MLRQLKQGLAARAEVDRRKFRWCWTDQKRAPRFWPGRPSLCLGVEEIRLALGLSEGLQRAMAQQS